MLAVGEQNSGKSTAFEKPSWLLYGKEKDALGLPSTYKDLVATITNLSFPILDNVDGGGLNEKEKGAYLDLFCGVSSGMEVPLRILFTTNNLITFKLRNHLMLTSRVTPFDRSDAMRRILQFSMRTLTREERVSKDRSEEHT